MKNAYFLLILTICLSSCTHKPAQQIASKSDQQDKNIALIKQYFAYFNAHEWVKMAEMYSENADFKDPSLGPGIVQQTRQETILKYSELNEFFPDLHDEISQIYPSGEKHVIVEFISTGTAPDDSKFELPICTIFTLENGKITKDYTYFDNFEEETGE